MKLLKRYWAWQQGAYMSHYARHLNRDLRDVVVLAFGLALVCYCCSHKVEVPQ